MRLWHYELIDVLPKAQLVSQWRELCAIVSALDKNGTPNHILVNKILDYPQHHIVIYINKVVCEFEKRGYKCKDSVFEKLGKNLSDVMNLFNNDFNEKGLFKNWHNKRYLTQCFYNLQEKYDCGGITTKDWNEIEAKYKKLINSGVK